ncbi:MAG: RidA family protein [Gammaproteobacteria bacterium]|nr:RidA family protein [Gammaproteobacteria bacterium]
MADVHYLNPGNLPKPGQYSHIARTAATELLFIAGQVANGLDGAIVSREFDAQCAQVFANIAAALASQGAAWRDIVQFTTYLIDSADIAKLREFRTREFPQLFPEGNYPPNTLLIVSALAHPDYRLEVQVVAAL